MKRLIEFPLEGGGSMVAEVEDHVTGGSTVRGATPVAVAEKAQQTFEESVEKIKPAASAIITTLRQLSDQPEQIAVEFGIKLSGTAGVVLASTGVEANFKVTLTWKRAPQ